MSNDFDLSWFALEKYDEQAKFSGMDWFIQLSFRDYIKVLGEKKPDLIKTMVDLIKVNPITDATIDRYYNWPVRDANYIDLFIASERNPKIREFDNLSAEEFDEVGEHAIAPNTNNRWDMSILAIDLDVTDEQLLLCFKDWLQRQRQRLNTSYRPKMFTMRDYDRWVKNMILPYLDLTLIASFENKKLEQHRIGGLLFPDEFDIDLTERIRKVVKPLADSLLDDKKLSALRVQSSFYE